jgi:hypothetical protein
MMDWQLTFPAASEMYTLLIAHLNSACNPILYAIFNPNFNRGYRNVLVCILPKKIDVDGKSRTKFDTNAESDSSTKHHLSLSN